MSVVRDISLKNFRIHRNLTLKISPKTTVIVGNNGSGKTSVLEAIYIILQGKSFKSSDKDAITAGKEWFRLDAIFGDSKRTVKYDSTKEYGKKQIEIDGKKTQRLSFGDKIPTVLFEPNDLRLLNGSPARRRQFIDDFICQINQNYQATINKYERSLKQRNNLLKKGSPSKNDLFIWDVAISEYGAEIIEQRVLFIEKINLKINDIYQNISKNNDFISLHYSNTYIGNIKQKIINELEKNNPKDRTLGYTTIGPHRDDVVFNFNKSPALSTASRGEIRTIVLALKFLEVEIIEDLTGKKPIILLDDVFSELDETRQKSLLVLDNQTIITSTKTLTKNNNQIIQLKTKKL